MLARTPYRFSSRIPGSRLHREVSNTPSLCRVRCGSCRRCGVHRLLSSLALRRSRDVQRQPCRPRYRRAKYSLVPSEGHQPFRVPLCCERQRLELRKERSKILTQQYEAARVLQRRKRVSQWPMLMNSESPTIHPTEHLISRSLMSRMQFPIAQGLVPILAEFLGF